MKLLRILKTETSHLLIAGFAIGAVGFAIAQPSTAQTEQRAATTPQIIASAR